MSGRGLSNRRTNNNNDAEPSVRRSLRVRDRNPAFPGGMPDTTRRSRQYRRNPIEHPALVAATVTIVEELPVIVAPALVAATVTIVAEPPVIMPETIFEELSMIELDEKDGIIASLTKERDDGLAQIQSLRLELAALKSKADSAMESQLAIIAEKSTVETTYAAPTPADLAKSFIEEECNAPFVPVVQLEEVETKSGEEEEEVLCSYRSKLFQLGETLLDKGTGNNSWMERGIGEARILRHRDNGRLRFLMRCEKTKKVIANHALDPSIELKPSAGSDKSLKWVCLDIAHGEPQGKVFALRFTDSEVAGEFKAKFEEYQAKM